MEAVLKSHKSSFFKASLRIFGHHDYAMSKKILVASLSKYTAIFESGVVTGD